MSVSRLTDCQKISAEGRGNLGGKYELMYYYSDKRSPRTVTPTSTPAGQRHSSVNLLLRSPDAKLDVARAPTVETCHDASLK